MAAKRKASRYVVPVAVAGVAAATIGLVPALAASGDPDLPEITAQQLIEKIAASDTQTLSGTFKISTDLGLPSIAGLLPSAVPSGPGGGSSVDPTEKLTQLISGSHTLRVAADGPDKQKLTLLDGSDEYTLVHNGDDVWAYDSKSNEVMHEKGAGELGGDRGDRGGDHGKAKTPGKDLPVSPKQLADEVLKAAGDTTSITVGGTANVAGRDAYQLVIKPKQSGSMVESVKIAVDAGTGTPLKFTLDSVSGGKPVLDAGFTKVDFAKPAADTFDFKAPKGAKVTEGGAEKAGKEFGEEFGKDAGKGGQDEFGKGFEKGLGGIFGDLGMGAEGGKGGPDGGFNVIGEGWTTIARLDTGAPAPKTDEAPKEFQGFLDSFGDKVTGKFGSGTVFKTKLVNALMTDDGKIYVGAVTQDALVNAANSAK
ncbi:outer membrane lipoprotein carrier protein LolA [Streptomyces sp. NPDC090025]|uniref:LolA family protein n=1 Tax=Streptomyces sp. NPDC090025 TaxID=3365922 RepID=UPI003839958D